MKTKSAFSGVVVLTGALIVVKVLSALYRVPYQNVLGDEGLYAYQQIYPIVALGMILSMNAIPSAVTQTLGGHGTAQKIFNGASIFADSSYFYYCIIISVSASNGMDDGRCSSRNND